MTSATQFKPLTGKRFGRLLVLDYVPYSRPRMVNCRCDCGNEKAISHDQLRKNRTNSCGCLRDEQRRINGFASAKKRNDKKDARPSAPWSIDAVWPRVPA